MWTPFKQALLLAAMLGGAVQAHGGAWNQETGHGQFILTSSYYQTSHQFDAAGSKQPFASSGKFSQFTLNPYFEYGLTRRNTLVVNANVPFLTYSNVAGAATSAGIGDIEIGFRRRLNSIESRWAVSGQLTTMFPGYSAQRNPAPGNHQEDIEARFLIGRGTIFAHRNFFWDAEAAYRYRSGAPSDQFRADLTLGSDINSRFAAYAQLFAIKGLRNGDPLDINNPNAQSDFDLYKVQISLLANLTATVRVQAGWNSSFSGRNTGAGQAAILALWKRF